METGISIAFRKKDTKEEEGHGKGCGRARRRGKVKDTRKENRGRQER